jgi:hypothetical protein
MPNTCTICRHKEREQIESALARGEALRDIAGHFQASKSSIYRHQTCIAAELQALKASRSAQLNESHLQRLNRYRLIAEQYLHDDEKALSALDRCYKQVDIDAKLTGRYQKKQENKPDAQRRLEITIEAYYMVFVQKPFEEAVALMKAFYDAPDEESKREAMRAAVETEQREAAAVWYEAEERVDQRQSTMIH